MSNEVSNKTELDYIHKELRLLYLGKSVDQVLINQYWRKIDYLEELVGGE